MSYFSEKERIQNYYEMIEERNDEEHTFQNTLLLRFYKELLKEEAKLIEKLTGNGDIDKAFSIYHYLTFNGWLSSNGNFEITAFPEELHSQPEMSICFGGGCCRHLAPHFANIMNYLNGDEPKSFQLVGTNYKTWRKKLTPSKEIMCHTDSISFLDAESTQVSDYHYPNHVEVYSNLNQSLYDPLNFNIQRINFSNQNPDNYIGPIDFAMGMMFDSSTTARQKSTELEDALKKDISNCKRHSLSDSELVDLRNLGIDACLDNMAQIQDFKKKNESAYQYVKKQAAKYTHKYQING